MFEAERILLTETPFVPVYTYVTKRMVNPRLMGWQSNVMDHHYSKNMFFLKAVSDQVKTVVVNEPETGVAEEEAVLVPDPSENPVAPVDEAETDISEEGGTTSEDSSE